MKTIVGGLGLAALVYVAPLTADDSARAVFAMICTREALSLGYKDEVLRRYVGDCVTAKMKVYDADMADPATAHIPKSC
jgi:hypothetical protein